MVRITSNEFKKHIDNYIKLGEKEIIVVTLNNKDIFTIMPKTIENSYKWEILFGVLPAEALIDNDVDRE